VQCSAVSHLWFLCFNNLILSSIKLKNNLLDVIFGFPMVTLQKNKKVFFNMSLNTIVFVF